MTSTMVKDTFVFFESLEGLNIVEQLCAFPYALLLIVLRALNRLFAKLSTMPDREILDKEFDSCLDIRTRLRLRNLLQTSLFDTRRFGANWKHAVFREKWIALLYFPFFLSARLVCGLGFAGKAREHTVQWFQDQSTLLDSRREMKDFSLQGKPIVMLGLLTTPIAALIMMFFFHTSQFVRLICKPAEPKRSSENCLVLEQNVDPNRGLGPAAFFFSPAYFATLFVVFVCGIPGWISWFLYQSLGIDSILGNPSFAPQFYKVFIQILLYFYPLGWCLAAIFFGAYFTFPLNFVSSDYEVEIYPDVIKKQPIKGWFLDIMMFWQPSFCSKQIFWRDVTSVSFSTGRLDETLKDAQSALGRMTRILEGISRKLDVESDVLIIKSSNDLLELKLADLSRQEKAQVFHALQKFAPSIYLDKYVQQALVGSTVLSDPRYTQIWFDILSRSKTITASEQLCVGQAIKDKYTVVEELESGGQARVFLSTDAAGHRFVLKEFQLASGNSLSELVDSASLFERESTILSQLQHPLIVRMEEMFIDGNRVYLVVDYIEGDSVRSLVKQGEAFCEIECIKLALQMCEILEFLHSQSPAVVHRDFTPDNLIVSADAGLKLIDFSSAHQMLANSEDCAGKHAYTPPEQFRGESCPQSDIYALGATLFYMITRHDPEPISRSSVASESSISPELRRIIETCTELDLEKRYESVQWLAADLRMLQGTAESSEESIVIDLTMSRRSKNKVLEELV
jgi:hypothetical protein